MFGAYGSLFCWSSHAENPLEAFRIFREELKWPFSWIGAAFRKYSPKISEKRLGYFAGGMVWRLLASIYHVIAVVGISESSIKYFLEGNFFGGLCLVGISIAMFVQLLWAWWFGHKLVKYKLKIGAP